MSSKSTSTTPHGRSNKFHEQKELSRLFIDILRAGGELLNLQTVITAGVDVNGKLKDNLRLLHHAVYQGRADAVKLLINSGADVNAADELGYTALHVAAKHGQLDLVKLLIDNNAIVDFFNKDEYYRMDFSSKELAELSASPLNLAIDNNHADVTELLLKSGANPNHEYFLGHEINLVPLDHLECLDLVLKYGAEPDACCRSGLTTLMRACKRSQIEAAKILIKHGSNVNKRTGLQFERRAALHFACESGDADMVELLLKSGAKVDIKTDFGGTPLEMAVARGYFNTSKHLLEHGAIAETHNSDGTSMLQVACAAYNISTRYEIVELLLEHGADPRYSARMLDHTAPSLSPLLEYLANVDSKPELEICKLLISHGAFLHVCSPNLRLRITDGHGMLLQAQRLSSVNPDLFHILLFLASNFKPRDIRCETSLTEATRSLIMAAHQPKPLKHQCRLYLNARMRVPGIIEKLRNLPLPTYLKDYLTYQII